MPNESLNDRVVLLLAAFENLKESMYGVNDYGDYTGFCDERDLIQNEINSDLNFYLQRVMNLSRRLRKYKEQVGNYEESDRV